MSLVSCFAVLISALDPALLGLALTYAVTLSDSLQYTARQSAEVENLVSDAIVSSLFFFLFGMRLVNLMMIIYSHGYTCRWCQLKE